MSTRLMLSRAAAIALRALVELARDPAVTLSVAELARRQRLPQPMLEQILLRLRRDGLVEARRGRHGGYRLALQADSLPLARVLQAVERPRQAPQAAVSQENRHRSAATDPTAAAMTAGVEAVEASEQIALGVVWGQTADAAWTDTLQVTAEDPPGLEHADATADSLGASAGHRVEQQLRRRLERLVQLELQRLTLAELLYDQRSWEASLGPEGGVMVM